jgi:hypothetical protein
MLRPRFRNGIQSAAQFAEIVAAAACGRTQRVVQIGAMAIDGNLQQEERRLDQPFG